MDKLSNEVWVFVEQNSGKPADVSFELLSKGRKLADTLKGTLKAVVIGHKMDDVAKQTFQYGTEEVLLVDHPALKDYRTLSYGRIMNDLVSNAKPRIVLFGATIIGRDLAPRVASYTKSGLTADCTDLQISDVTYLRQDYKELLLQIRPAFGGNIIATIITPDAPIQMATVREGVMENHPLENPKPGKIKKIEYKSDPIDDMIKIIERHQEENKINLKSAPIIVAGGWDGIKREF